MRCHNRKLALSWTCLYPIQEGETNAMGVVVGARHAPRDKDEIPHKMIRQNFRGVYDWFGVIKRKEEEKMGIPY